MNTVQASSPHPFRLNPTEVQKRVRPQAQPVQSAATFTPDRYQPQLRLDTLVANGPRQIVPQDTTYMAKFGQSVDELAAANIEQLKGAGQFVHGAATTAVWTPLGMVEAVGRTAVAMTGGQVEFPHGGPIDKMGKGIENMGVGAYRVLDATDDALVAATKTAVYAPLATVEAAAVGAGVVVGGAVRAGKWTSEQVQKSFVGQAFAKGYESAMPSAN